MTQTRQHPERKRNHPGTTNYNTNNNTNAGAPPLLPSRGARLTYTELEDAHPPQPPTPETRNCVIYPAISNPSACIARLKCNRTGKTGKGDDDANEAKPSAITLVRAANDDDDDDDHPKWAYGRLASKRSIPLNHHEKQWGKVWFGVAYPRATCCSEPRGTFVLPQEDDDPLLQLVAVKQLNKSVVADYLLAEGPENPYVEICRLQEYSRESCVLDCWEALEDSNFIYIVAPMANGGNLYDLLFSPLVTKTTLLPKHIHSIFVQLLHILDFLERENIHHRDLSPDNLLLASSSSNNSNNNHHYQQVKVMDFALSMRIPVVNGRRTLIQSVGSHGTHAYMAPELVCDDKFDGVAADLWSVMVIFYNLHTRHKLYDLPLQCDWSFNYFILQQGLTSQAQNEAILNTPHLKPEYRERATAHLAWPDHVRDLLGHTLRPNPRHRWTLAQVINSDYVQNVPE